MNSNRIGKYARVLLLGLTPVAAAVALALIIAGCSKDNSVAPLTEEEQNVALYNTLFTPDQNETMQIVVTDSVHIDHNIGTGTTDSVIYIMEGRPNMVVFDSSLADTQIQLSMHIQRLRFIRGVDSTRSALLYDCRPDGTVFDDSLVIDADPGYFANNPISSVIKLYIYSDSQQRWLQYDTTARSNPRIVFYLTHFSKYAIAD